MQALFKFSWFAVLLIGAMSPVSALASGNSSGGGGKVVVCRKSDGTIRSAELLDLWEARTLFGRKLIVSSKPTKELVTDGIERLKSVLITWSEARNADAAGLKSSLDQETSVLRGDSPDAEKYYLRRLHGVTLSLTDDSFEIAHPSDCAIEQVINYVDLANLPTIYINQDLFDALDNINQAALILHEGLYRILRREYSEQNSLRTRRAVGVVMAGESFRSTYDLLAPAHITCTSTDEETQFHVIEFTTDWERTPSKMLSVYVEKFAGSPSMGFEKFSWGVGGSVQDIFDEMFNPLKPVSQPLPYNHLYVDIIGPIEPEFRALLEVNGKNGAARNVTLTLLTRVTNTVALPVAVETKCRLVPARK